MAGNLGGDHPLGSPERLPAIWAGLRDVYATYLGKGQALWNRLQAALEDYDVDPSAMTASLQQLRGVYERRHREHYATAVREGEGGLHSVSSSGFVDKPPDAVPQPNIYLTNVDLTHGILNVIRSYATSDEARIHDVDEKRKSAEHVDIGLPLSEILWQQYLETARSTLWVVRDARARAMAQEISGITVHQSSNAITQQVVFMAYPDGTKWDTSDRTWMPDSEEFKAILATPNVAMAVHMLLDHMDEIGGKTITKLVTRGNKDHYIDVPIEKPPDPYEDLEALVFAAFLALAVGLQSV
jgi:hypothetical protein